MGVAHALDQTLVGQLGRDPHDGRPAHADRAGEGLLRPGYAVAERHQRGVRLDVDVVGQHRLDRRRDAGVGPPDHVAGEAAERGQQLLLGAGQLTTHVAHLPDR